MTQEDVDALTYSFSMAMDETQAMRIRRELLEKLIWDGGMKFWMDPKVKAIRMWRMKDRHQKGQNMIAEEADRCLKALENGEKVDYSRLFILLDTLKALLEWRV